MLSGILEVDYFQHYILFSEALWLLLQSTVPLEDIERAELLLQEFCLKFSALYGMHVRIAITKLLNTQVSFISNFMFQQGIDTAQLMFICYYIYLTLSETSVLFGLIQPFHLKA